MKTKLTCMIALGLAIAASAHAGSATWNLDPTNGDWNTAANWTPAMVPNGPSDTATFQASNITDVSLSGDVELDTMIFDTGASSFILTVQNGLSLSLSGTGLQNNSDAPQQIVLLDGGNLSLGRSATAGDASYTVLAETETTAAGSIDFVGFSSADRGSFTTQGQLYSGHPGATIHFHDNSTAGEASFLNDGSDVGDESGSAGTTIFSDRSTAGSAYFDNRAGTVPSGQGGTVSFTTSSSAGTATIVNRGSSNSADGGHTTFSSLGYADHSRIINEGGGPDPSDLPGYTVFAGGTAGSATFLLEGSQYAGGLGGYVVFSDGGEPSTAVFTLTGGRNGGGGGHALFEGEPGVGGYFRLLGNSVLDISAATSTVAIESVEGKGTIYLGSNLLIVEPGITPKVFSGVIRDGSPSGDDGSGSLMVGSLQLTGANTYSGGTTIAQGELLVSNTTGSGTGTGPVEVRYGTLGGSGTVAGPIIIGIGWGLPAHLAPGAERSLPAVFTTQDRATFALDGIYDWKLNSQRARADQLVANGVTIDNAAQFVADSVADEKLAAGTVFTAINNTAATPISGTFGNLSDGDTIIVGSNTFQANYEGGDGNDLTLTVVP